MASRTKELTPRDIFLYVPNLIGIIQTPLLILGYTRIALAMLSFYFITLPHLFLPLYGFSCLLDVADGYFARRLNQCSRLGAVLDMVTDRSTTAGLLCHLCALYPQAAVVFQVLVGLDLSSHYMHMYASLAGGKESHKKLDGESNWLLRLYYTERQVMFLACAGNEAFFMALYMLAYQSGRILEIAGYNISVWLAVAVFSAPIWAFKQTMNVVQLVGAAKQLAEIDVKASTEPKKHH